jgi:mannose-1-phosphate guanylyltransferase
MLYALVMAGGSGTRFWPESRATRPKQLLSIVDERTMIQATVDRIAPLIPSERTMVVCGSAHGMETRKQLQQIAQEMILLEPRGRNTAPCIALGAYKLAQRDPEAVMVVLPADHIIRKEREFLRLLGIAAKVAAAGTGLVTLGIVPDRPETGYGYIERGEVIVTVDSQPVYRVRRFVEKPDLERAKEYVAEGKHFWNSGMFVWKVSEIIRAFVQHLPKVAQALTKISPAFGTPEEAKAIRDAYEVLESVSIDYGIMEKADNVVVIPAGIDWNDVGSWNALEQIWKRDENDNAVRGEFLSLESRSCIVSSTHKMTVLVGVEDLIVVDTPDALMVCRKDRAQDVRKIHELLDIRGHKELL